MVVWGRNFDNDSTLCYTVEESRVSEVGGDYRERWWKDWTKKNLAQNWISFSS